MKSRAAHSLRVSELVSPSTPRRNASRRASEIRSASPLRPTASSLGGRSLSSDIREPLIAGASAPEAALATNRPLLASSHSFALAQDDFPSIKRPFLTGSAPQTEFDVTHSKQTPKKFLTGSRTAIKLFNLCTRRTRDFAWANLHSRDASHGVKALLLGSASPVENDVTHSKQRLTEFLPGATT